MAQAAFFFIGRAFAPVAPVGPSFFGNRGWDGKPAPSHKTRVFVLEYLVGFPVKQPQKGRVMLLCEKKSLFKPTSKGCDHVV